MFDRVIATDASEKQIANAQPHPRVEYRLAPAENSGLQSATVDLIMVGQALHWFDLDGFYQEARRMLKDKGVLAASAYNLLKIDPPIDEILRRYYHDVVGPFWTPERKVVETFAEIPFPFHEISSPKFEMRAHWNLDHLIGYLRTWSASQRFMEAKHTDPVELVNERLQTAWGDASQTRMIIWPLTLRVGVNDEAKCLNTSYRNKSNRHMKIKLPLSLFAAASLALSSAAFAAGAKTYQVTGPVLEVTDSMIVIEKGAKKERWEINRDANTKVTGDLKVGEKVTVTYTMTATEAEVKAGKGKKKEAAAAPTP